MKRLLSILLVSLSGCAVLTIDVDVYKGPLANHEDVQLQQLVAMAVGVRPILLELRDTLQEGAGGPVLESNGWEPDPDKIEDSGVARVNGILALYDDRSKLEGSSVTAIDSEFRRLLSSAREQIEDYRDAHAVLTKDLSDVWDSRLDPKTLAGGEHQTDLTRLVKQFFLAVPGEFRYHGSRWTKAHEGLHRNNKKRKIGQPALAANTVFGTLADGSVDESANAGFEALSQEPILEAYAELLFSNSGSPARRTFISEVKSVAEAFHEARRARHALLVKVVLDGLSRSDPVSDDRVRVQARREGAALAVELLQPQHTLGVLTLAGKKAITVTVKGANKQIRAPKPLRSLRNTLIAGGASKENYDPPSNKKWTRENAKAVWPVVSAQLRELLFEQPRKTAEALLAADQFFRDNNLDRLPVCTEAGLPTEFTSTRRRKYGLASGPVYELEDDAVRRVEGERQRVERARAFLDLATVGLEGGRLEVGLETLIRDYLTARKDCLKTKSAEECRDDANVDRTREMLLEALVRFAEKVLVIANNDVLLKDTDETRPGLVSGLTLGTLKYLFVRPVEPRDPYPLVLQAVGNSILLQADELRHRRSHEARLRDRFQREAQALNLTAPPDADAALAHIVGQLHDAYLSTQQAVQRGEAERARLDKEIGEAKAVVARAEKRKEAADELLSVFGSARDVHLALTSILDGRAVADFATETRALRTLLEQPTTNPQELSKAQASAAAVKAQAEELEGTITAAREEDRLNDPKKTAKGIEHTRSQLTEALGEYRQKHAALDPMGDMVKHATEIRKASNEVVKSLQMNELSDAKQHAEKLHREANDLAGIVEHGISQREGLDEEFQKLNALEVPLSQLQTETTNRWKAARETQQGLVQERRVAQQKVSASQAESTRLETAIQVVEANRASWAKKFPSKNPHPTSFLYALIAELATDDQGKPSGGDRATAASVLRKRRLSLAWTPPLDVDSDDDARAVLDALIATLEYQRLEALKAGGDDSPQAASVSSALKAAYEYRSGMVYIRPPSAYLRTSYPSTSLQADPDLRWRNMLGENAGRGIPFSENLRDFFYPEGLLNAQTIADIDKQFWQSINRVRVNGVGNTNYAIVKDDIGNWYLKSFATDPKDIIESAKNLALFSLGASTGANALQNLPQKETVEGFFSSSTRTRPSVTESTFRRFQSAFDAKAEEDFENLQDEVEDLAGEVRAAWTTAGLEATGSAPLGRILDQAATQLEGSTPQAEDVDYGLEVIKGLRRVRRFRSAVTAGITENSDLSADEKDKAREIVDRRVALLATNYLDRRRQSLKAYHAAIVHFGNSVNTESDGTKLERG